MPRETTKNGGEERKAGRTYKREVTFRDEERVCKDQILEEEVLVGNPEEEGTILSRPHFQN